MKQFQSKQNLSIFLLSMFISLLFFNSVQGQATTCPNAPVSRLIVGEQGRVGASGANNLRAEPSTSAGRLGEIPANTAFIVIEGPTCADGFAWWRVDYAGLIGWTAEGQGSDYWLEPAGPLPTSAATVTAFPSATSAAPVVATCPGFLASRLIVGEQGRVVPGPSNNLRAEAASGTELLAEIPGGASFLVLEGPLCAAGLAWWRVDYRGIVGWTPEGSRDVYWLEPTGPLPTQAPTLTPSVTPTPYPTYTPMPTYTPIPAMPSVLALENVQNLIGETLPENLAPIDASNVHRLVPLSIIGKGNIDQVEFSPNGELIVVLNGLGVWLNHFEGENVLSSLLDTPDFQATEIALSPNGQYLAIGSIGYEGMAVASLQIWDLQTGERLEVLENFRESIQDLAFSPDGTVLAIGAAPRENDSHNNVWLVSIGSERLERAEMPFRGLIRDMSFSPDSQLLAVSSYEYNGVIEIYSIAANEHQISYEIQGELGDILFSPDGGSLLSAGGGGERSTPGVLRVWDVASSERINSPRFAADIRELALSPNGRVLAVTSAYGSSTIELLNMQDLSKIEDLTFTLPVSGIRFAPDGRLAIVHFDGSLVLWDIESDEGETVLDYESPDYYDRIAVSPNGNLLALSSNTANEIQLIDMTSGKIIGRYEGNLQNISYLAFDDDGVELHFAFGSQRYIWNLETGSQEITSTEFVTERIDSTALYNLADSLYPRRFYNLNSVHEIPNSSLIVVNEGTVLSFWDVNTRLPLARTRYFGNVVGFNTTGTVMITNSRGAFWLWGIPQ